jgi:hypothetical protein
LRARKLKSAHLPAATFARATTSLTSSLVVRGKTPTTSPVAGLIDSNVDGDFVREDLDLMAMG